MANEAEIELLARTMKDGFDRMDKRFDDMEKRFDKKLDDKVDGLENKLTRRIEQLELKVDKHHQETQDALGGIYRVIGGISSTLTDHEERIKTLEE